MLDEFEMHFSKLIGSKMTNSSTRNQWLGRDLIQHKSSIAFLRFFSCAIALICLPPMMTSSPLVAQTGGQFRPYMPNSRNLIRGDMPPGVAADLTRLSNPKLEGHVQPVRVVSPIGARLEVNSNQGYVTTNSSRVSVGLQVGPVYRFKVTNIPRHYGKELYPSVEVLGKLNPPQGLENEFPIQVVIAQEDLEEALQGRLVTKVVYLENPELSLPHRHQEDKQPYLNIGAAQDPLKVARTMGRPMAILRIGSRIPMPSDQGQEFGFNAPSPSILPDPQGSNMRLGADSISPVEIPGQVLPPIVPGNAESIPNSGK